MFTCETENETMSWIKEIEAAQNQKDVKHALKLMDMKNKMKHKMDNFLMLLTFNIPQINLIVAKNEDWEQKWLTFQLMSLNAELKRKSFSKDFLFKISEITLSDDLHNYKNHFLHNIITSVNPDKQNQKELINIDIKMLDPKHPEYKNTDLEINGKFGHCFINYKPLTIIKIVEFIKQGINELDKMNSESKKLRIKAKNINEINIELKHELIKEKDIKANLNPIDIKIHSGVTLLKLHFKWDILSISLIHYETFLNTMELNLSDVDFYTILTDKMLVIKGSLNDLTIQDLSNYPKIIYHEEDYFKVIKKEIFGKTEKQRDSSILDFSYTKIISSDLIEDNFDSFIDLKIHSIKANVYVQIIMNLVDYFMIQILGVINNPDLFIQNLQEPNFKNTHISEVIAKIKNPRFMKLSIFAENFFIVLKPLPDSEEFFVVKLTKIEVNNKITKSKRQILNENPVMTINLNQ